MEVIVFFYGEQSFIWFIQQQISQQMVVPGQGIMELMSSHSGTVNC